MTRKELTDYLGKFPADTPIKILLDSRYPFEKPIDLTDDHLLVTANTALVNAEAPEDQWDCEEGKIELGDGQRYILFNPILV